MPRHLYHPGRYLRIKYDQQPHDKPTNSDNNINQNTDKTPTRTNKNNNQIPDVTPTPVTHDTTIIETTKLVLKLTITTETQPTENTQTETVMTNSQLETETETDTESEILTTTTPPCLTRYEMDVYPPDRQKHILCWRDYVQWNGKRKKDVNFTLIDFTKL